MRLTDDQMEAMLANLIDAAAAFDPAATFLGVATALDDQGPITDLADVTQATGAMATRQALTTWGAPYKMADGRWVADSPLRIFSPASAAEAQIITHWFYASLAVAGVLMAWGELADPVSLPDENANLNIVPRITLDPDGRWSAEVVFNG